MDGPVFDELRDGIEGCETGVVGKSEEGAGAGGPGEREAGCGGW